MVGSEPSQRGHGTLCSSHASILVTKSDMMPLRPITWRLPRTARRDVRVLLLVLAVGGWSTPIPPNVPMPITLFDFASADEASWNVVNDGVMGGRSAGYVTVADGTLRFTGTLVTQGGGFTSVRARRVVDLTGHVGLELRVRGSGRRFEVEVDDGLRTSGRSVSRRAPFPSTTEWTLIRIPFNTLRSTIFGQAVKAPPIDLAGIQGVGLYMADGKDGPFRLEVDYIRAYGAGE